MAFNLEAAASFSSSKRLRDKDGLERTVAYQNKWRAHDTPETKVSPFFMFALRIHTRGIATEVADLHHAARSNTGFRSWRRRGLATGRQHIHLYTNASYVAIYHEQIVRTQGIPSNPGEKLVQLPMGVPSKGCS